MTSILQVVLFAFCLCAGANSLDQCTQGTSYWCKNYHTAKQCDQLNFCKQVVWAQPVQDDEVCVLCKDAIEAISSYINKNGTKEKVKNALDQLCSDVPIPSLSKECLQLISQDFDMLYDEVVSLIENQDLVCGILGLCKSSISEEKVLKHLIARMPMIVKEAMERNELPVAAPVLIMDHEQDCSDCTTFLRDVQNAIKNNSAIVSEWRGLVKSECDALGPGLSGICNLQIQEVIDSVIHVVFSKNDAASICKSINMCSFRSAKVASNPCSDCKDFFTDLENMIKQNDSLINDIVNGLSKFYCLQKPEYIRRQCARFVAVVIRTSLHRILVETPNDICQAIDFCQPALASRNAVPPVKAGDPCKDCTAFMTDLQGVAKNNQSIINDLTDLVKEQCDQLGPGLSELCKAQVTTALPNLLPQFEHADVGTICTTIMMCSSPPSEPGKGGDLCNDCIAFTEDWQNIIQNNKTVISNLLDQAAETYCNQLPDFMHNQCDDVARSAVNKILTAVQTHDAELICSTVYMCDSVQLHKPVEDVPLPASSVQNREQAAGDGELCEICKIVVTEVDRLLERNASEADISAALEKVCGILSSDIRAECQMFVQQYASDIIDLLLNELSPDQVCSKLTLCKAAATSVHQSISCELCETVAEVLDNLLDNNSTEQEIIAAVEKVCSVLPSQYKSDCDQLIQQYGEAIIQLLVNLITPDKLCSKLGLCGSTSMRSTSSDMCEVCILAATELEKLIEEHSTVEDIVHAVERVCSLLPSQYSQMCDMLVSQYAPQIIQALVNELPPRELCSTIGVCSSALTVRAGDPCKDCTAFMTDLQGVAKNNQSIINDLTDLIKGQCDQLGPGLSELCKSQVSEDVPNFLSQFEHADVGTICTTIMMCSSPPSEPGKGGNLCNDCIAFTEDWQNIIQNNKTVISNFFVKTAEAYCNRLPFFHSECDHIADQVVARIINAVQQNDAETICSTLYMCGAAQRQQVAHAPPKQLPKEDDSSVVCEACKAVATELDNLLEKNSTEQEIITAVEKVCSLVPAQYQDICDDLVDEYGKAMVQILINAFNPKELCTDLKLCPRTTKKSARVSNPVSCAICRIVVHELDRMIRGNRTEAAIVHALSDVCKLVPGHYAKECRHFIAKYGSEIATMLINEIESGVICTELLLCSRPAATPARASKADTETCDLCVVIATELENLLTENSTEAEITHAVEKVCSLLPSQYSQMCDMLVSQYGPKIIQALVNKISAEKLCSTIGICSSALTSLRASRGECLICQMVVADLEILLMDERDETAVLKAAMKVCSLFPEQLKSACDNFIETNGPRLILFFVEIAQPELVCLKLHACSLGSRVNLKSTSDLCPICELVASELDRLITANSTQAEFEAALDKVCSFLPGSLSQECDDFIASVGPAILKLLASEIKPSKLCTALKLCTKKLSSLRSNGELCDVCKVIIGLLDDALKSNATREDIKEALENVCDQAGALKQTCDEIVAQYTDEILDLAEHIFDPSYICIHIRLCPTKVQKHLLGTNPCTYGPSYWCRDRATAAKCNATEHCRLHVWN